MKKSTMVALAACLGILRMEAGNAFLGGFTLNDGASQTFAASTVGESAYVDFKRDGSGLYDIEVLFEPVAER